jgi:hypothetical protein
LNKYTTKNLYNQMGKLKEYYLNNLTEEEIKEKVEDEIHHLQYLWELKETSTSQSEEDKDTHQTYPF